MFLMDLFFYKNTCIFERPFRVAMLIMHPFGIVFVFLSLCTVLCCLKNVATFLACFEFNTVNYIHILSDLVFA